MITHSWKFKGFTFEYGLFGCWDFDDVNEVPVIGFSILFFAFEKRNVPPRNWEKIDLEAEQIFNTTNEIVPAYGWYKYYDPSSLQSGIVYLAINMDGELVCDTNPTANVSNYELFGPHLAEFMWLGPIDKP